MMKGKLLNNKIKNEKKDVFKTIELQRKFMEKLYKKLELQNIDDWSKVLKGEIYKHGGRKLLKEYYGGNKLNLLKAIYPEQKWTPKKKESKKLTEEMRIRRVHERKMEKLYKRFKLRKLNEWLQISPSKIRFLKSHYNDDMKQLLESIYPNYPWEFSKLKVKMKTKEKQQEFMDEIYRKFQLNSLEDWLTITQDKLRKNGGFRILYYYKFNLPLLFRSVYPNFPWDFTIITDPLEYQRRIMERLFYHFNFVSLDDWLTAHKFNIILNGGGFLYNIYRGDLSHLLSTLYPNFPWDFSRLKFNPIKYFKSIENQRNFMDQLFYKLNFKSFDDWSLLSQNKIIIHGGNHLITRKYSSSIPSLLQSIYPNFPWFFPSPDLISQSIRFERLKNLISTYRITQKKDWYRISLDSPDLIPSLIEFFPTEKWHFSSFRIRSKKSSQRLLFSFTQQIYPSFLILEDYLHPMLFIGHTFYELDLFIPALQLALEYQGRHHYDDMPGVYAGVDSFLIRDQFKLQAANDLHIRIVHIPFWWDQSLSSLQSSLLNS